MFAFDSVYNIYIYKWEIIIDILSLTNIYYIFVFVLKCIDYNVFSVL